MLYYRSADEARERIRNSVIFLKKEPVLIREVLPDQTQYFTLPLTRLAQVKQGPIFSHPDWVAADIRLGYMNTPEHKAKYIKRYPYRQYMQGIADGNVLTGVPFTRLLEQQEFVDMLRGKYPNKREVMDMLDHHRVNHSIAFDRRIAFNITDGERGVEWRGEHIGTDLRPVGNKFSTRLLDKFRYMKEYLGTHGIEATHG